MGDPESNWRMNNVKRNISAALGGVLLFTLILQAGPVGAEGPLSGISGTPPDSSQWQSVEKVLGPSGVEHGDMLKIAFPRTDLNVSGHRIPIRPGLDLTRWVVFQPMPHGTRV